MSGKVGSTIAEFYADKTLLITGATGFVGKVLLEKLLFSCPDIKRVYVLVRPKRGVSPAERVKKLISSPIFQIGRIASEALDKKIVVVHGDLTASRLGLSMEDTNVLISEVEIVFHSAASVRFSDKLKVAMGVNLIGTMAVTNLCHEMSRLVAFVHVSTAFSNCHMDIIEEKLYPTKVKAEKLIEMSELVQGDAFDSLATEEFYEGRPNSYIFTKALAENYVHDHREALPVTIARLPIVSGAYDEPEPGFCDFPSATNFVVFCHLLGMIRSMNYDPKVHSNSMFADRVANGLIAIGYKTGLAYEGLKFYNVCCSANETCSADRFYKLISNAANEFPSGKCFRAPVSLASSSNLLSFYYHRYVSEILFCVFVDILMRLMWKKSDFTSKMLFVQSTLDALHHFHVNEWNFDNGNYKKLEAELSETDAMIFPMSTNKTAYARHLKELSFSLRKYKLGETVLRSAKARRRAMWLVLVEFAFHGTFLALVAGILYKVSDFLF